MHNDLDQTFGEICGGSALALQEKMRAIQGYPSDREEAMNWLRNLRFLDISKVPVLGPVKAGRNRRGFHGVVFPVKKGQPVPTKIIPITERKTRGDQFPRYLAVSYCWNPGKMEIPPGCTEKRYYKYMIKRQGETDEQAHESEFPHRFMDRVIRVAQSYGITKIWIDKECIYQGKNASEDFPRDQELGTQVMDVVYENAAQSVGLLTTWLYNREEVAMLLRLYHNECVKWSNGQRQLRWDQNFWCLRKLIDRLLQDNRWSRAWIFHEDHLAGQGMSLLVPHPDNIVVHDELGVIPGEILIPLHRLKACITALYHTYGARTWREKENVLLALKRYKVFNKLEHGTERTTTYSVLVDLCARKVTNEPDRIPILANALRFPKRLNTDKSSDLVRSGHHSLSIALLTLVLMNGEILCNVSGSKPFNIMDHSLQSYLEDCEMDLGSSERSYDQWFLDHCRFGPTNLTKDGLQTDGWVFRMISDMPYSMVYFKIHPAEFARLNIPWQHRQGNGKHPEKSLRKVIRTLCNKLDYRWPRCPLANMMIQNIDQAVDDRRQRRPPRFSTDMFCRNMNTVARALLEGQTLRALWKFPDNPDKHPPSALVVHRKDNSGHSQPPGTDRTFFMSWHNIPDTPEIGRWASLEVAPYEQLSLRENRSVDDTYYLHVRRSVDGVWDVRRRPMDTVVFSVPGFTAAKVGHRKKRPRGDGRQQASLASSSVYYQGKSSNSAQKRLRR